MPTYRALVLTVAVHAMRHRRLLGLAGLLGLCACGGSGDGDGGPTPINLTTFQAASDILGQSTATGAGRNNGAGAGSPNAVGFDVPVGHAGVGSVYVADNANNRVVAYNSLPTGFGASADFVLGQGGFTTNAPGTSATTLRVPSSCWVADDALFVCDSNNERVLIYSPPPTATGAAAGIVLGKPDLVTEGATAGQNGLDICGDLCVASHRIVVADTFNSRVMVWNGIPATNGANAQVVVGQPDFTTTAGGTNAAKMLFPNGLWTDGTRLVVADTGNHRVLIWNTFPTLNGQPADLVVGQPDFTTVTPGVGAQKMNSPTSVVSDGSKLFVSDTSNNRVLIFDPFPTANNPAAVGILGQTSFSNVARNDDDQNGVEDATPTARTLSVPGGLTAIGNKLLVCDVFNARVLVFVGS